MNLPDKINLARDSVLAKHPASIDTAVILGSGLSGITLDGFEAKTQLPYASIPALPRPTAPSHEGHLTILENDQQTVALCAGRHHLYEGYTAQEVCILTYLLAALGCKQLIITNAAGSLNPNFRPGDVMLISDHINFTGLNPLIGQDEQLGIRFPDMSNAYCKNTRCSIRGLASKFDVNLHEGVYLGVSGPSLETSAERRMFRTLGADAVGMSTVLEVVAANHAGMSVTGLSAITNLALGDEHQQPDTIEEVIRNAAIAGKKLQTLLNGFFKP